MTTTPRAIEPNDIYRLRLISDAQIAPDGSRIAFVIQTVDEEKNDYVSNIYVTERDGTVTQFTSGDKDSSPRWSPDGKWLAFVSGRKERGQIHLLSTRGGESTPLTDRKFGAGAPVWSPDSSAIGFVGLTSTDPEEEKEEKKDDKKPAPAKITERASYKNDGMGFIANRRAHLFAVDLKERKTEQLTEGDFSDSDFAWSPDGQHIAFSSNRTPRWDVALESYIYLVPRTGGQARQVTTEGSFGSVSFSPDGGRIIFAGIRDVGNVFGPSRIYSVARDGNDLRDEMGDWDASLGCEVLSDVVHSSEGHGTPIFWRADGIYFLGTEHGESNIYRLSNGRAEPVTRGSQAVTDFSIADDGTVAYVGADMTHLSEVYLLEGQSGNRLTHENDAFLEEVYVSPAERIPFTGKDGHAGEGWLIKPQGAAAGKHPLIVYIHGGPQLAHGEAFFLEYQYLVGQGFGVFFPNLHGSSSYGHDYQLSIASDWGNLDFADVIAGTEAAASREWVDAERMGIGGGSYGGYMTSWVIGHDTRFKAAVVERCLCNMVSFMGTTDSGWIWDKQFGVFPEDDVQKLWAMSPIAYVKNVETPTLVIHSERDDRTPIEQGEQYFGALRRLGKECKFIIFPEESHGLSRGGKPSRRIERMGYIRDWFRQYL